MPNHAGPKTPLEMVRRRAIEGRRVVALQRAWVSKIRKAGLESAQAERFLATLERILTGFEADLRAQIEHAAHRRGRRALNAADRLRPFPRLT